MSSLVLESGPKSHLFNLLLHTPIDLLVLSLLFLLQVVLGHEAIQRRKSGQAANNKHGQYSFPPLAHVLLLVDFLELLLVLYVLVVHSVLLRYCVV